MMGCGASQSQEEAPRRKEKRTAGAAGTPSEYSNETSSTQVARKNTMSTSPLASPHDNHLPRNTNSKPTDEPTETGLLKEKSKTEAMLRLPDSQQSVRQFNEEAYAQIGRSSELSSGELKHCWVGVCRRGVEMNRRLSSSDTEANFVVIKEYVTQQNTATLLADLTAFRSLSHRLLAPLHGAFVRQGTVVTCNEFFPDGNIVARAGHMNSRQLQETIARVGVGVRHLYLKKLPHRHVTLSNLFMTPFGVVVGDCGLGAHFRSLSADQLYGFRYRAAAMFPPETLGASWERSRSSTDFDEKCDVWALGCIAYSLAIGAEPFPGETREILFDTIVNSKPQFPVGKNFGEEFVEFIEMCLTKDPDHRPNLRSALCHKYLLQNVRMIALENLDRNPKVSSARPSICRSTSEPRSSLIQCDPRTNTPKCSVMLPSLKMFARSVPNQYLTPALPDTSELLTPRTMSTPSSEVGQRCSLLPSPEATPLHQRNPDACSSSVDIHVVTGDILCSNCRERITSSYLGCRECDDFALCPLCAAQNFEHTTGHQLETFFVESMSEEQLSETLGTNAATISRIQSKFAPKKCVQSPETTPMNISLAGTLLVSLEHPNNASSTTLAGSAMLDESHTAIASIETVPAETRPKCPSFLVIPTQLLSEEETTTLYMRGTLVSTQLQCLSKPRKSLMESRRHEQNATPEACIQNCVSHGLCDLDLADLQMSTVPQSLFNPPVMCIAILDLSDNNLTELPGALGELSNLKDLCVAKNRLASLPTTLGDLALLQRLDANHNELAALPQEFMFLDSLNFLSLDFNRLKAIPEVVFDINGLRTLYLAANFGISTWPALDLFSRVDSLELGIDNEPDLYREYFAGLVNAREMKTTEIMWNKIYPDEVISGLFCGSLRAVQSQQVYDKLKVTHILTAGRGLQPYIGPNMQHLTVLVDDFEGASMAHVFEDSYSFIDQALKNQTGCIVHCFAGMSRSATAIIAYLMKAMGKRLDEAYNMVREARPAVYPNKGFLDQLIAYDTQLYPDGRPLDMASMQRHCIPA